MGTIQIKKVEKTVVTGKQGEARQKVKKTYGKIIYRGTLSLNDMAEHIMKHGTVYNIATLEEHYMAVFQIYTLTSPWIV